MEGYRKHRVLFDRLGATIITASVDEFEDMRLLTEGERFPKREKNMGFTICYGVTGELADSLGAYWYDHEKNKDIPYIMVADKDYIQPAEFIIDCEINKVISCIQ